MATGNPFFGKVRGKVGGVVLRVEHGKQIVSEYNGRKGGDPSQGQIDQRARMAMANAVSRAFPWETIIGWNVAPAVARNKFVGSLIGLTTITGTGTNRVSAVIDVTKIQLSDGCGVPLVSSTLSKVLGNKTEIDVTCVWSNAANVRGYLLAVLLYNTAEDKYERVEYVTSTANNGRVRLTISEDTLISGYTLFCYAVPMNVNTLAKEIVFGDVALDAGTAEFTAETLVSFKRADILGASVYLGTLEY